VKSYWLLYYEFLANVLSEKLCTACNQFYDSDTSLQNLLSAKNFLALTTNHYSTSHFLGNCSYLLKYKIATVTLKALFFFFSPKLNNPWEIL